MSPHHPFAQPDQPEEHDPRALPSEVSAGPDLGGQPVAVIVLAAGAALLAAFVSAFLLPPSFFAAMVAYGPVVLLASVVFILHIRAKGLEQGDPPER